MVTTPQAALADRSAPRAVRQARRTAVASSFASSYQLCREVGTVICAVAAGEWRQGVSELCRGHEPGPDGIDCDSGNGATVLMLRQQIGDDPVRSGHGKA